MQINNEFKPKIVAFCCNWCSYAGADLAGTNRLNYPADVKIIRVVIHSDKKKVEVPKTITDENGKKQKVTELGEKAFVKCSNVKQIVLHANIVYVNENAFSGISTKDKTIFLDASLTKKEVKKIEKKLRKAGFKGSIVQAKKNPVKKTADK